MDGLRARIVALARGASLEIIDPDRHRPAVESLDRQHRLFVASLRDDDAQATTIPRAIALHTLGFTSVPHIAVRGYSGWDDLERAFDRLASHDIHQILLLAGDGPQRGSFADTAAVLNDRGQTMLDRYGMRHLAFAGHPGGSPYADTAALTQAVTLKNDFVRHSGVSGELVTQFCPDLRRTVRWASHLKTTGNRLPIRAGIAGPVPNLPALLRYMRRVGVRPATIAQALPHLLAQCLGGLRSGGGAPCLHGFLTAAKHPDAIDGVHLYGFGQFGAAAQLVGQLAAGAFDLTAGLVRRVTLYR